MISKENNFDLIRLLAALQVVLGHGIGFLHVGEGSRIGQLRFLFPGVPIFFTISGFLISASWERTPHLRTYFRNRFLRIFPGLWACFAFTLTLILLFKVVGFGDLLHWPMLKWILAQLTFFQSWTLDLLSSWGSGIPNWSLWSIPVELQFYLLLPFIYLILGRLHPLYKLGALLLASVAFNAYLAHAVSGGLTAVQERLSLTILPYFCCFAFGSILYHAWGRIRRFVEGKAVLWMAIYLTFWLFSSSLPSYFPKGLQYISNLLLSILTISAAFTLPQLGRRLRGHDLSYGIYLYNMPVINGMIALGWTGRVEYLLLAFVVTVALAALSWYGVERRTLRLKG